MSSPTLQSNRIQTFDPLKHNPPKYDIFGQLKKTRHYTIENTKQNILAEKDNIKVPWYGKNETMTRSKLFEMRKNEKIPDISYDLDRDGYVGGRDYVLAKRFDKDMDGKLNEREKKEAYEAIHSGVEDKYVWNLDNQGSHRAYRIMQKRGKIIDAEDFLPIRDTYPNHPISSHKPSASTFTDLKDKRKSQNKQSVNEKIKTWERNHPSVLISEPLNIDLNNKPPFNSVNDRKAYQHRQARINCGLKEHEDDIKIVNKDPTLKYVYSPKNKTRREIKELIKKENVEKSVKLSDMEFKDEIGRLKEREQEIFEKLYSNGIERMTLKKLKKERKKETLDYNVKTFSKQTIGVHGQELPKFSDNEDKKEYWKLRDGYVENPKINSHVEYKENIKYWKKPEELYLNEHREGIPSPDTFSKVKVMKDKKEDIIIKVNGLNHFKNKGFDPDNPKPIDIDEVHRNHIYKWTTLVNQFAPQKFKNGRFFDSLPQAGHDSTEDKGVYSSFGDGVFESKYLKGAVQKRKKEEKFTKSNNVDQVCQDNNVFTNMKESLFQRYSSREVKSADKPKSLSIITKGF